MLMQKGEIVYQGRTDLADAFFTPQGYACPDKMNPADHLLDLVTLGVNDSSQPSYKVKKLQVCVDLDFGLDKNDFTVRAVQPWLFQFYILMHRNFIERIRRWDILVVNVFVTCLVAVFIGMGSWHNLPGSVCRQHSQEKPCLVLLCDPPGCGVVVARHVFVSPGARSHAARAAGRSVLCIRVFYGEVYRGYVCAVLDAHYLHCVSRLLFLVLVCSSMKGRAICQFIELLSFVCVECVGVRLMPCLLAVQFLSSSCTL